MKLIRKTDIEGTYTHWCQGCQSMHQINTIQMNMNNARWYFNGDFEKPTFTPSINVSNGQCHYNITDGNIVFHDATNHELGGTTQPLIEMPK